jgi:hypothetical protein
MAKKTATKKKSAIKKSAAAAKTAPVKSRPAPRVLAALNAAQPVTSNKPADLHSMLDVLRDKEQPIEVRFAALQSLGAAGFSSPDFAAIQGDYIAALREVATDADPEMRRRALGILAREKDGFALKKLLDGLKNPAEALLPPEKALQLLGSDIHTDAYPVAREILKNPPNPTARREALRLLASDASSAPTFESILQDKKETPEIRQISAAALHALKPEKLQEYAREILLDPSEHADMHQTSLTALTQFGAPELADDKKLITRVNRMSTTSTEDVKNSARQFLGKYKVEA